MKPTHALACWLFAVTSLHAAPLLQKSDVFPPGLNGVARYRIPGVVVTPKGTVLAYGKTGDHSPSAAATIYSDGHGKTLEAGPSACSDLAVLPDGTVLCLYERDTSIAAARFNLEWVTTP